MKLLIFDQPKKTITNVLHLMGWFFLFITAMAIGTLILWTSYPQLVSKIDRKIPDFYGESINALHERTNAAGDKEQKYLYYAKLYEKLENISIVNRYYAYRQESARFLINYYLENNRLQQAMKLADKWAKDYPSDFSGKMLYFTVQSFNNEAKALLEYENFYHQHKDIIELRNAYISFLFQHKQYRSAFAVAQDGYDQFEHNVFFKLFYNDDKDGFSEQQSVNFRNVTSQHRGAESSYGIKVMHEFKNLKSLRFDIDALATGLMVKDITVLVEGDNVSEQLTVSRANQLVPIRAGHYLINGGDPYFIFDLPRRLKKYSGSFAISCSVTIDRRNTEITKLINSSDWKIYLDNGNGFTKNNSYHLSLQNKENKYIAFIKPEQHGIEKIRIDFPSYPNLQIKNFNLIVNNQDSYDKENISLLHNLRRQDDFLEISDSDPYAVIDLKGSTAIKMIKAEIIFTGTSDE